MRAWTLALLLAAGPSIAGAAPPDRLADARRLYNLGQYDQALDAARQAAANPATQSAARLIIGRARLERYRRDGQADELEGARGELRGVDARALDGRERVELQVGLAELLYLDEHFGTAAELLNPILDGSVAMAPDAHERALEWWASWLDRPAPAAPAVERAPVYTRIIDRMEQELRRDPSLPAASYWLAAAARGAGDLDRASAAAAAAWLRASLRPDRSAALRTDVDRLVKQVIIPERASKAPPRERRQDAERFTADWDAFKKNW